MWNKVLLDCEYFACIDWYAVFLQSQEVDMELYEFFERKTYRNRCEIAGPNGKITLSVPLEHGRNQRAIMKDIKVCNNEKWQLLHWKTLCACYRRAPFFEYYEYELEAFFNKNFIYLIDVLQESHHLIMHLLKASKEYTYTIKYEKNIEPSTADFRSQFSPQKPPQYYTGRYMQIFEERNTFLPNLSILDMLFACGNRTQSTILEFGKKQNI